MPEEERPRERLVHSGAESLSTAELIAIILGSGSKEKTILQLAQEVVARFGSLPQLAEATLAELLEIKGIGAAKAIQLKAAFNLGLRASRQASKNLFKIFDRMICLLKSARNPQKFFSIFINMEKNFCGFLANL